MLSEDQVKKSALRFLKNYYKFRPRIGETRTSRDMEGAKGIIADGYLSFVEEDGQEFTATIEATSFATREELFFRLQRTVLAWDSVVFASVMSLLVFVYGYVYNHFTIRQVGTIWVSLILLGTFLLSAALFYFLFKGIRRYRYIYAIEQFKRYHANEQWVALAKDVFGIGDYDQYVELKNQCVLNGFGMIEVDEEAEPHPLVTPSRQELFKNKRKVMTFLDQENSKTGQLVKGAKKQYDQLIGRLLPKKAKNEKSLLRYQKTYVNQIVLTTAAMGLIGLIFYKQMQQTEIKYVDELVYEQEMAKLQKEGEPEDPNLPERVIGEDPFEADESRYTGEEASEEALLSSTDGPPGATEAEGRWETKIEEVDTNDAGIIAINYDQIVMYDCERFFNFQNSVFIVQDQLFDNLTTARNRFNYLNQKGLKANLIWLGCFSRRQQGYVVYYELMYESKAEAREVGFEVRRQLKKKNIPTAHLAVRSISRK